MIKRPEIILLIGSIVLSLIVVEIGVRIFASYAGGWYGYPAELFIADDERGYKFQPGYHGFFTEYPYKEIPISINSAGLRDIEHDLNAATGTYRILGLGDSVTFGAGVAVENTYLSQLENLLKDSSFNSSSNGSSTIEIIKTGINGYEFDQYSDFYFGEGYTYKPNLVLVGLVLNDIVPITPDKVEQMKANKGGYASAPKKNFVAKLKGLVKNACRTCLIASRVIKISPVAQNRAASNLAYTEAVLTQWETEWDRLRESMLRLQQEIEKNGAEMVLVVFPYTEQFKTTHDLPKMPQEKVIALGAESGFKVIDLTPLLDTPDFEQYYLQGDNVHPNIAGHKLIAEKIREELYKNATIN